MMWSLPPGAAAPDFSLPAVNREGQVTLTDYKGRTPLLLALFRGVYCPFCRRAIAQLGVTADKLRAHGVETLAVTATPLERARLYFRYRPARIPLAADPDLTTFRAFQVPKPEMTPKLEAGIQAMRTTLDGVLPRPMSLHEAANLLDQQDGFQHTPEDNEDIEKQFPQLVGQFLLDQDGIIRWVNIEGAQGLDGLGKFPTDEEFLAAAATLRR
jgi:peroxiredoxin